MNIILLLIDYAALLVWVRLWSHPEAEFTFNPFLSGIVRLTDRMLRFPAALRLPPAATAAVALVALLAFKCLLAVRFGLLAPVAALPFLFPPPTADAATRALLMPALFMLAGTAAALVAFWSAYAVTAALASRVRKPGRALETFAYCARPFSLLPAALRLPVLMLTAAGAVAALAATSGGPKVLDLFIQTVTRFTADGAALFPIPDAAILSGPAPVRLPADLLLGLVIIAAGLSLLTNMIMALLVGRLFSSLFRNPGWSNLMGELLDMIAGRFARRLMIGGADWTPLLQFFIYALASGGLSFAVFAVLGRLGG